MRSVRSLVVVAATVVALSALAPAVSAASPRSFHLDKTCSSNVLCALTSSTFKAIPAGTNVSYVWDTARPWLAYPTIAVRNGRTTGVCDWNQPGTDGVLAICTFANGSGRLTQFHLRVNVTVTGDPTSPTSVWHWDGQYWFGG
jgi:hypothetical protein